MTKPQADTDAGAPARGQGHPAEPLDRLMLAEEVAEVLVIPKSRVYQLARDGELPHLHVGRYVRFRRTEVAAWIERGSSATSR